MDYKLAKQLKDAGFSQKAHNSRKSSATTYYSPTLEELIDACKQKDRCIELTENQKCYIHTPNKKGKIIKKLEWDYYWIAMMIDWNDKKYGKRPCYESGDEIVARVEGKTPLEAIAKLYIKLHEKN